MADDTDWMTVEGNTGPESDGVRASNSEMASLAEYRGVRRRARGGAREVMLKRMPLLTAQNSIVSIAANGE